jgi:hypothetical protein
MALNDLIDPVNIPVFSIQVDGAQWIFPGATVSSRVYAEKSCLFDGTKMMDIVQLLSLSDHAALLYLALKHINGEDLTGVSAEAINGAMAIFYNKLVIGLTLSNPDRWELFFGEGASDYLTFIGTPTEDRISASWTRRYGTELKETFETSLPRKEGIAVKTSTGYLDPRTGMPYETKPAIGKFPDFLKQTAERLLGKTLDGARYSWRNNMHQMISSLKQVSIKDLPNLLKGCEWVPRFYVSHNFGCEPLPVRRKTMVSMTCIDNEFDKGYSDIFMPVLGYNDTHCGMQIRPVRFR